MLKDLWRSFSSVSTKSVRNEQRELKHHVRNTEAKVDFILHELVSGMREDRSWQEDQRRR